MCVPLCFSLVLVEHLYGVKVQTFLAHLYFLYHREAVLSARCVLGPPALLPSQGPPREAIPHVLSVCEAAGPVDGG